MTFLNRVCCCALFGVAMVALAEGKTCGACQDPSTDSPPAQQDENPQSNPAGSEQPADPGAPTDQEPAKGEDGQADLNAAFDKKISARSSRDLEQVVELCQSALRKGLSEGSVKQANELMISALMEHADELVARILQPEPDRRWQMFRREALRKLEQVVELDAGRIEPQMSIAKLNLLPGGSMEAAAAAAEKAVELAANRPKELSAALVLRSATVGDDTERRLADLSQAVKIDPDNVEAVRARGFMLLAMDQPEKAIEDIEAWLKLDPQNIDQWRVAAVAFAQREKVDEALRLLDLGLEANPESSLLHSDRAQIRAANEDNEGALADAARAIELDGDNFEAWLQQASLQVQTDQFDAALESVNRVLDENAFDERALWLRSIVLVQQEKYEDSLRDLRWLTENVPDKPGYRLQFAGVLNAAKQPRKAIEAYDEFIAEFEGLADGYRGRGDAWLSLGEHAKAIKDYEQALELESDNSGLLNNFAWLLATSPVDELRDGKRAIEMATQACELTEFKAAHILSTLASGYAETGDFVAAREWAEKAVALAESDEQRKGLQEELDSYKLDKPWRELENVEAEAAAASGTGGDQASESGDSAADNKADEPAPASADDGNEEADGKPDESKKAPKADGDGGGNA